MTAAKGQPGTNHAGPLAGLRVLELGQMVSGPYTTRLMAEFGAEVIKLEPPGGGDPLRGFREMEGGTSLWWYAQARNKKCITLDLRKPAGAHLATRLAEKVDVLVENFRPGALKRWGLAPDVLLEHNPMLVIARISGFGQSGPYRDRPGFGSIAESIGGLRYVTGYPDRPPVRLNLSFGDSVAALYAGMAVLAAIHHRNQPGGRGQVIDVALYESCFALMESLVPDYSRKGYVREREGTRVSGITPQGTYTCQDGKYVVIGGNSDTIFKRLMLAIGRPDLAEDPALQTNPGRNARADMLDKAIEAWTRQHSLAEAMAILVAADVPAGPIYSAPDIFADPHFQARGMLEQVDVPGLGPLHLPAIVPKFSRTPGRTRWPGPALGAHNDEIYGDLLGLSVNEIAALRQEKVI